MRLKKYIGQNVEIDYDLLVIYLPEHDYEIDLERAATPFELVDSLFQIQGKMWATHTLLAELVQAFNAASREIFGLGIQAALRNNAGKLTWREAALRKGLGKRAQAIAEAEERAT